MRYNPNFEDQFLWKSSNDIQFNDIYDIMKSEITRRKEANEKMEKRPASPYGKTIGLGVLAMIVFAAAVFGICYLITKSFIYSLIMSMCGIFIAFGISLIYMGISLFILLPKRCSEPVVAVCIGHSISGNNKSASGGVRILRCPVFEYNYGGENIVAFDAIYENTSKIPCVGLETTININPARPDELVWNHDKSRFFWFIGGAVLAIALGISFIWLTNRDQALMNSIIPGRQNNSQISSENNTSAPAQSEDGRILLTDDYLNGLIDSVYPGTTWTICIRKLEDVQPDVNGETGTVGFFFEPDASHNFDAISSNVENLSENALTAKPGDEFYFVEFEDKAATLFSCKDYVYTGDKLK